MTTSLSKIWENTDGCAKLYICDSVPYLILVMSQCYSIIIYRVISVPGHGKEVGDGLNDVDKRSIHQFLSNDQLPGSNIFDSQMQMNTGGQKYDLILDREFQHHLKKRAPQKWCH